MRDRLKKKIEKRNRRLIHELLDLALDINGLSPRKQELTGSKPTVFFYLSGHVADIDVHVHWNGWKSDQGCDYRVSAETDNPLKLASAIRKLKTETPGAATPRESRM